MPHENLYENAKRSHTLAIVVIYDNEWLNQICRFQKDSYENKNIGSISFFPIKYHYTTTTLVYDRMYRNHLDPALR